MKEKTKPLMVLLSQAFYERNVDNEEILVKHNRPYLVLLVEYRALQPKYRMSSLTYYKEILLKSKKTIAS